MTTSTANNTRLTQKKAFDIYSGQHYRVCLKTLNAKRNLKQSARHICDVIEVFFSTQNKDRAIFNITDLKKKCNYKDDRTIISSLIQINELGIFFIRDLSNDEFIIFAPKDENIELVEQIDSNNDECLVWLLKHTKEVGKINKKLENLKNKAKTLFSGIVKKHQDVKNHTSRCKKKDMIMNEKRHDHVYSYLLEFSDIEVFKEVQDESLDLLFLDLFNIDHQSLDLKTPNQNLKTSSENLKQKSNKNDDDFLKNFDKEEEEKVNPTIEVLEEKNDKVDPSEQKTLQTDKPDLTHTQKSSGGAGANCEQNVDKLTDKEKELYSLLKSVKNADDKILTISEKDILKIIKEVPENRIREEIERTAVRRDKKQNQAIGTPYFLSLIFKPESTIPEALKQKQIIESKETAKHTLAPIIKIFREWYKDNENLNLAKNSLFLSMKTLYEQNTSRFIDKVHYCKKQFENFNDLAKELFTGEILEVIQAI